eukprot:14851795-Alexandrium_andersonii.AAC.1
MGEKLEAAKAAGTLPPSYASHPVVAGSEGTHVYPIALYVDGVKFTRYDSVVAFYVHSLLTG